MNIDIRCSSFYPYLNKFWYKNKFGRLLPYSLLSLVHLRSDFEKFISTMIILRIHHNHGSLKSIPITIKPSNNHYRQIRFPHELHLVWWLREKNIGGNQKMKTRAKTTHMIFFFFLKKLQNHFFFHLIHLIIDLHCSHHR